VPRWAVGRNVAILAARLSAQEVEATGIMKILRQPICL